MQFGYVGLIVHHFGAKISQQLSAGFPILTYIHSQRELTLMTLVNP